MSPSDFDCVAIGSDVTCLEAQYGSPFRVTTGANGIEEYRYIHRYTVNSDSSEQTDYIFYVESGKIIGKDRRCAKSAYHNQIY